MPESISPPSSTRFPVNSAERFAYNDTPLVVAPLQVFPIVRRLSTVPCPPGPKLVRAKHHNFPLSIYRRPDLKKQAHIYTPTELAQTVKTISLKEPLKYIILPCSLRISPLLTIIFRRFQEDHDLYATSHSKLFQLEQQITNLLF